MPGSRLPATRDLALRLEISRGTVLAVYGQLGAEGYIQSATGKGSLCLPLSCRTCFPDRVATGSEVAEPIGRNAAGTKYESPAVVLSARGKEVIDDAVQYRRAHFAGSKAFRTNQPDVTAFPFELWKRIASSRSRRLRPKFLADGDACGYKPLREAIAGYLRSSRGITCFCRTGGGGGQRPTDT